MIQSQAKIKRTKNIMGKSYKIIKSMFSQFYYSTLAVRLSTANGYYQHQSFDYFLTRYHVSEHNQMSTPS